ncbi:MAG: hypothetical protein IJE28_00015 [Oscillospiraceae bacterium]|nr:hypothetical protein [Oscillospiraceae bacterium]MBQ3501135.1 hypothetical protein [Oscillospiraceae bacterium]
METKKIKINENGFEYEFAVPPFPLEYEKWKKKQAQEYFDWFVEQVPVRAEYVLNKALTYYGYNPKSITDPETKLLLVWRWFLKFARLEETSAEEREANRPYVERFGKSWEVLYKLTPVTEFFIRDIGMLFGKLLYDELGTLTWGLMEKPRSSIDYNQVILKGFVFTEFEPPFITSANPIHLVSVQAANILDRTAKDTDLVKVYNNWREKHE